MSTPPVARTLRLQVRRADLKIAAPIDTYLNAELVPKFNPVSLETCGTFLVRLPMRRRNQVTWRLEWNPAALALLEDDAGLVASLDGVRFFSGFAEEPERSRRGTGSPILEVFGYSDESLFAGREAWPVPGTDSVALQDAQPYDVRRGPAETVIKNYWTANVGTGARLSARIPPLTIPTTTGLGRDVTGRARFDNLAALTSELCASGGGLGWRILQDGTHLHAQVFQPRDRTKHARFSPALRNLDGYQFATRKGTVTRSVVAGGGQGVNRLFRELQVPATWQSYREQSIDRRRAGGGTDEPLTPEERAEIVAELDQDALEAIESGAASASLNAPVRDTPAVGFLRPDNQGGYRPLDKVTVSIDGVLHQDVVRQVSVKAVPGDLDIRPTVGVPNQGQTARLVRRLRAAEARLARIERSQ